MKYFKIYPREYELVFTGDEMLNKKCDLDNVSVFENIPGSLDEYIVLLKKTMGKMELDYFDNLVKVSWLYQRFCYFGRRRIIKPRGSGFLLEMAFVTFIKNYVGYDNKFFIGSRTPARVIISYFNDFFPGFNEGNPFTDNYEYPFKYMNLGCLYLVYGMEERMDLLAHGEKHKMSYAAFNDYVVNYIQCYNKEHGDKYIYYFNRNGTGSPSIITNKNYEEFKACDFSRRKSKPLSGKHLRTKSNTKGAVSRDN